MCRVLVVDDDKNIQGVIKKFLSSSGHEVSCVSSLKDYHDQYENQPLDVILLDLNLRNGERGEELIEEAGNHIPAVVIVITGESLDGDFLTWMHKNGVLFAMQKPLHLEELAQKVRIAARFCRAVRLLSQAENVGEGLIEKLRMSQQYLQHVRTKASDVFHPAASDTEK